MRTGAFALLSLVLAAAALAQAPDDEFLNRLYETRTFSHVAISPDGKRVAWAVENHGLTIANADGANRKHIDDATAPAFSPDSAKLAWLAGKSQKQLFVNEQKLTDVRGYLAEPAWSPDGKSIAFLFIEQAKRDAGPLVAMSRAVGEIESTIDEQRIAVVDVATKKLRVVTPADMYVYHFDWAPDSRRIAAEGAPGSGDNNYWVAKLHVVDVLSATMRPLYTPKLQIADPRWSPDGKSIALIEGLMSDEGSTGGDVLLVDAATGAARNLAPNMKASATTLQWSDAQHLTAGEIVGGDAALVRIDVNGGAEQTLWRGPEHITTEYVVGTAIARDGTTSAVIRSSFAQAPEVWVGPIGAWKKVSSENAAQKAAWGSVTSLRWKSDDFDVQGWLLAPAHVESGKRYPIVVWVHGGPASAVLSAWPNPIGAFLSMKGFYVLYPNFRGSYGNGEAFTQANVKDFGGGDLRDMLRGIDAAAAASQADANRAGMWGWSYGGFMSMLAVTQTNRFKAAVAGAGIANWLSYYGENDIDQWMIPYFGASVYDDPAPYARASAINFIKNAKTPTLVLVGERDGECPAPQSFEFWHALKSLGVETKLVVYADEGHRISQPEHKRDIARRVAGWFDQHLR
ncbi:MAG TPA: S9 family peptidase [Thermoanaerobaculia bacterium]|nr:S9 family peptidase [Thermoanaerobaculia bacterium]